MLFLRSRAAAVDFLDKSRIMSSRRAGVAQLVEQLICNQQVTSSSLVAGSKATFWNDKQHNVVVWPSGQWHQTVNLTARAYGGSNPPATTIKYADLAQ